MTLIVPTHSVGGDWSGANPFTGATPFKVNVAQKLTRIGAYTQTAFNGGSTTLRVFLWSSSGTLLASGVATNTTLFSTPSNPAWQALTTPYTLAAETVYYAGYSLANYAGYSTTNANTTHAEPTVSGVTVTTFPTGWTTSKSQSAQTGGTFPLNTSNFEFGFALDVSPAGNVSYKSGGAFTQKPVWVKVGGVWKQAPPTLDKSGGVF